MNNQIKLAEAMGWTSYPVHKGSFADQQGHVTWKSPNPDDGRFNLPDPFTDANDDYAVLEHFRCRLGGWDRFQQEMDANFSEHVKKSSLAVDYQIGDYARAALKVIDDV